MIEKKKTSDFINSILKLVFLLDSQVHNDSKPSRFVNITIDFHSNLMLLQKILLNYKLHEYTNI